MPQVAQLAEIAGFAAGPAAAAAAELELVGEKWFGDLQQTMTHDMLQQYVNTAPLSQFQSRTLGVVGLLQLHQLGGALQQTFFLSDTALREWSLLFT